MEYKFQSNKDHLRREVRYGATEENYNQGSRSYDRIRYNVLPMFQGSYEIK